jgi:transposase
LTGDRRRLRSPRAQIHAGYRSVTGTARLGGQPALEAIRDLIGGNFAIA